MSWLDELADRGPRCLMVGEWEKLIAAARWAEARIAWEGETADCICDGIGESNPDCPQTMVEKNMVAAEEHYRKVTGR